MPIFLLLLLIVSVFNKQRCIICLGIGTRSVNTTIEFDVLNYASYAEFPSRVCTPKILLFTLYSLFQCKIYPVKFLEKQFCILKQAEHNNGLGTNNLFLIYGENCFYNQLGQSILYI